MSPNADAVAQVQAVLTRVDAQLDTAPVLHTGEASGNARDCKKNGVTPDQGDA